MRLKIAVSEHDNIRFDLHRNFKHFIPEAIPDIIILNDRITDFPDVDFVVFGGGADVTPSLYNRSKHTTTKTNPKRDLFESYMFQQYWSTKAKFVGICRGHQFINIMLGGTLHQHLPDLGKQHAYHHRAKMNSKSSLYNSVIENTPKDWKGPLWINSTHHQAVNQTGQTLMVTLRDAKTDIIEGTETLKGDKVRTLQCHPEMRSEIFVLQNIFFRYLFRFAPSSSVPIPPTS